MASQAFTLTEMFVVVAVIAILILLLMPREQLGGPKVARINCATNLKQVRLAFQIWAADNGNRYPMAVFTNKSGEQEFASQELAYRYFQVMSNEVNNPKILTCPADDNRTAATNFTTDFNSSHISYFIGLEADEIYPKRFLAGDNHMTNGTKMRHGILEFTGVNPPNWTNERHNSWGNVLLADGSVMQWNSRALRDGMKNTGMATNRLLFP